MPPTIERLRTRILRGGILALLLSSAAPACAAAWRGSPSPPSPPTPQHRDSRIPTWAPATLVGEVLVKTDALGRLAIVVDEALDGRTSRGAATRLFLLTPAAPVTDHIEVRLRVASVIFRGDSLSLSTPSGSYTVDVALQSRSDGRREVEASGIVLHDGIALQSLRFAGTPLPIEAVPIDAWPSAVAAEGVVIAAAEGCQAGGDGSTTCTKKCSLAAASMSFIDECSVTCNAGYHACCNCIVPRQGATCTCVKDVVVGPKQPGGVKVDLP